MSDFWNEFEADTPAAGVGDESDEDRFETEPGIDEFTATCPWCFEPQQLDLDPSGGSHQRYVEDCWVCCRPCVITVRYATGGDVSVEVERE